MNFEQFPVSSDIAPIIFGVAPQFTVRSTLAGATLEAGLRAVIQRTAPDMAIMSVEPLQVSMQKALSGRHLALRLGSVFSLCGLFLAAIGVYGVLAYSVVQRHREIGIRMALGCSRLRSVSSVVFHSATLGVAGLLLGLARGLGLWTHDSLCVLGCEGVGLDDCGSCCRSLARGLWDCCRISSMACFASRSGGGSQNTLSCREGTVIFKADHSKERSLCLLGEAAKYAVAPRKS